VLPAIPAPSDMVRKPRPNSACNSCHATGYGYRKADPIITYSVPGITVYIQTRLCAIGEIEVVLILAHVEVSFD